MFYKPLIFLISFRNIWYIAGIQEQLILCAQMLKQNQKSTERNHNSLRGNPFANRTDAELTAAVAEIEDIAYGLRNEALDHVDVLRSKKNDDNFLAAYEIKSALFIYQDCHQFLTGTLADRMRKTGDDHNQKNQFADEHANCLRLGAMIDRTVGALDSEIERYRAHYPNTSPHFFLRMGATATILASAYGVDQWLLADRPGLEKTVIAGVTVFVIQAGYHDEISNFYRATKNAILQRPIREVPYHVSAIERLGILSSEIAPEIPSVPHHPAQVEAQTAKQLGRREVLRTCFRLVR
jgi:hypothetical protein